ncbi:hypothetical protein D9M71_491620 [compost metagenome]
MANGVVTSWRGADQLAPKSAECIRLIELVAQPPMDTETYNSHRRPSGARATTGLPSLRMYLPVACWVASGVTMVCSAPHSPSREL